MSTSHHSLSILPPLNGDSQNHPKKELSTPISNSQKHSPSGKHTSSLQSMMTSGLHAPSPKIPHPLDDHNTLYPNGVFLHRHKLQGYHSICILYCHLYFNVDIGRIHYKPLKWDAFLSIIFLVFTIIKTLQETLFSS